MRSLAAVLIACLAFAGCSRSDSTAPTDTAADHAVDKVLVVVVENRSLAQMRSHAPHIWELAQRYGYASRFTAITHPSLPNYLALAAGSTLGVTDDDVPARHRLTAATVFGGAIRSGRTAGIMAEGMGSTTCRRTNGDQYVARHVPWTYFVRETDLCRRFARDASGFESAVASGDLPNVGMLIPDQCHNAHDCSLARADDWVADQVRTAMAGPDWRAGRLAIVITADEDDRTRGNRILTVVVHPSQDHHVVTEPLTLYSLHRLMAEVGHTEPLLRGRTAPDMARAFGLQIG